MSLGAREALTLVALPGLGRKRARGLLAGAPAAETAAELVAGRFSTDLLSEAASKAARLEELALELGQTVLGPSEVPRLLLDTRDPPIVLFVKGDASSLHRDAVAVVGTRKPSDFGARAAARLGRVIAEAGVVVVSGLALGCDAAGHRGCLDGHGVTVAVVAHGLDSVYPPAHDRLAEEIVARRGALVSEYPPGTRAQSYRFIERDRIQAGLSRATIVVETGFDDGTMHTVRACLAAGRRLACVVHPTEAVGNAGNRHLLATGQAMAVDGPQSLQGLLAEVTSPGVRGSVTDG